jgi:hypothetical protein
MKTKCTLPASIFQPLTVSHTAFPPNATSSVSHAVSMLPGDEEESRWHENYESRTSDSCHHVALK